ncbi:MAG TPA: IS66 family insertion sequence element accessory protein TnpB [Polyangiaceae bacterium]|nr:IS66 family insertion sequence element accessory protein TnpB [Polyangiaceae bacterium]
MQPRTSAEEWQKRVERWRESGLSADQFAAELGINAGTLRFWQYKLGKATRMGASAEGGTRKATATGPTFVEVRSANPDARFELELGNGRRIRVPVGFDPRALEQLLAVLERR